MRPLPGWEVRAERLSVPLPPGFSVREDTEFVYVFDAAGRQVLLLSAGLPEQSIARCIEDVCSRRVRDVPECGSATRGGVDTTG
ncbi:MAG: hypothetical protein QN174_07650 [Armatimonadota bacterium]|nr:hypothetical protein [Armatimonadota bacterium]